MKCYGGFLGTLGESNDYKTTPFYPVNPLECEYNQASYMEGKICIYTGCEKVYSCRNEE